jgi:hypothetical protein
MGLDPIKLGRMFEKIDDIHEDVGDIKKDIKKQNGRISKLENWRAYVLGIGAVLAVIISVAVKALL